MNFNVYLDDETAKALTDRARATGTTRNAVIRQAVASLLKTATDAWPEEVRTWQGDPGFTPFEYHRRSLGEQTGDPFAVESPPRARAPRAKQLRRRE